MVTEGRQHYGIGRSRYVDSYPGFEDPQPRVYLKFRPGGVDGSFLALLDTGGHFCILSSAVADVVRDQLADSLGSCDLRTVNGRVRGELFRHQITLIADEGQSLDVEATLFVPPDWYGPCFIGYSGVLERICFAVDPQINIFHFGPL